MTRQERHYNLCKAAPFHCNSGQSEFHQVIVHFGCVLKVRGVGGAMISLLCVVIINFYFVRTKVQSI